MEHRQADTDRREKPSRHLSDIASALEPRAADDPEEVGRVLKERADALARPMQEPALASEVIEVVTFRIGDERYALETRFVQEVIEPRELTAVPGTPRQLAGVCNLRGEVLAVMDPASVTGAAVPTERDKRLAVLVLGEEFPEFGLLVTELDEVISLRIASIGEPGIVGEFMGRLVRGLTPEALIVLDGAELLTDPRFFIDGSND